MAYELHIERENGKITTDEWISAIERIKNAKLDASDAQIANPKTGEVITIAGNQYNVAVKFESSKLFGFKKEVKWLKCIYFRNGFASFKATDDATIQSVVFSICNILNAEIVGDNGEKYHW